jgi:hypothetical protein
MTSASGALLAIRRSLYLALPPGVTDDFFISVQAPVAHRRLIFEPAAVATGPIAATQAAEFRRKVRIFTAGLRGVWAVRRALNPRTHGGFALQLFTHKVLRRLVVLPQLTLLASSIALSRRGRLYRALAASQLALHGAAAAGYVLRAARLGRSPALSLPLYLDTVNAAALVALWRLARGDARDDWVPERVSAPSGATNGRYPPLTEPTLRAQAHTYPEAAGYPPSGEEGQA